MERGNSSHQPPSNSTNPNPQYPPNFSSSQSSSQIFGYTQNPSFHLQIPTPQFPQTFQHPQFAHIYQTPQFPQPSQMPINIQSSQFLSNMQFSQFRPISPQCDNEGTFSPTPGSEESSRRTVWSIEDDKMLARAWVTIGQDERRGNAQKGEKFWKRIEKYYNDNHPNRGPTRTHDKLRAHWNLIRPKTHDFHAIYCKLQSMRPSGASDADIICRATEEYKQKHKRDKFGYEHVWAILKDLPAWASSFVVRQRSFSQSSTDPASSPSIEGSPDVQGSRADSEEVFPRPMGQKAAKRKAKARYTDDDDDVNEINQSLQRQIQLIEDMQKKRDDEFDFKRHKHEYETHEEHIGYDTGSTCYARNVL